MPDIVSVKVDMRQLQRALDHFDRRADAANIEGIVAETVLTAMDDLVESQGNGQWPPFSPVTLKIHPERKGAKLLQLTGKLIAFQATSGPGFAEVKSPAPYGEYQQRGTTRLRGLVYSDDHGIPARDFTGIDMKGTLEEACASIVRAIVG
jgi:phage gpG-like protein